MLFVNVHDSMSMSEPYLRYNEYDPSVSKKLLLITDAFVECCISICPQ